MRDNTRLGEELRALHQENERLNKVRKPAFILMFVCFVSAFYMH